MQTHPGGGILVTGMGMLAGGAGIAGIPGIAGIAGIPGIVGIVGIGPGVGMPPIMGIGSNILGIICNRCIS